MTDNDENVFAGEPHQAQSRRRFLTRSVRTLGAALASAGIYELIVVCLLKIRFFRHKARNEGNDYGNLHLHHSGRNAVC
jgi:hypothetical protein